MCFCGFCHEPVLWFWKENVWECSKKLLTSSHIPKLIKLIFQEQLSLLLKWGHKIEMNYFVALEKRQLSKNSYISKLYILKSSEGFIFNED